jgi:hypothetical protein
MNIGEIGYGIGPYERLPLWNWTIYNLGRQVKGWMKGLLEKPYYVILKH